MNEDNNRQEAIELTTTDQPITPDPMYKVAGVFESSEEASAAIDDLNANGFAGKDVELFCGDPGQEKYDFSGAGQGVLARLLRTFRNSTYDRVILDRYEAALRTGNCLVMVYIHKTENKAQAAQILHDHNAHEVDYFGLTMTEHISDQSEASA